MTDTMLKKTMFKKTLLATSGALLIAGVLFATPQPLQAQQFHWFYDSYGDRDEEAFYRRGWGERLDWRRELRRRRAERAFRQQLRRERREALRQHYRNPNDDVRFHEDTVTYEPSHEFRYRGPAQSLNPDDRDFVARPEDHRDWRQQDQRPSDTARQQALRQDEPLFDPPVGSTTRALETPKPKPKPAKRKTSQTALGGGISCSKARTIVADFGFTDIEPVKCSGAEYSLRAKRDGKPFEIHLSGKTGELTNVKRL